MSYKGEAGTVGGFWVADQPTDGREFVFGVNRMHTKTFENRIMRNKDVLFLCS